MDRHFHEELERFNTQILRMAERAEQAIDKAVRALVDQNADLAREVIAEDKQIDEWENEIDTMAVDLLALNQPMAIDLRSITTGIHVNSEMEMIADLAVNVAQRAIQLAGEPPLKPLTDIERMAAIAKRMVRNVGEAFIRKDIQLARQVIEADEESDRLRDAVFNEVIYSFLVKDGSLAPRGVPIILVARDCERMCDRAVSIAEDIIYMIQAKVVRHHPERLDA